MSKINHYLFLHLLLLFYSFCSVFSKLASNYTFLSLEFCIYYGISLLILGIYALLWQQILKKFSLTTAFINKSITIIWGMILGVLIFKESVTISMIIGSIIIVIGIVIVVTDEE